MEKDGNFNQNVEMVFILVDSHSNEQTSTKKMPIETFYLRQVTWNKWKLQLIQTADEQIVLVFGKLVN